MLQNLFYILFISITALIWGLPLFFFQRRQAANGFRLNSETIILSFFAGIIIIGLLSSWLSLFFPITYPVLLILTLILAVFELLWLRKAIRQKILTIVPFKIKLNAVTVFFICTSLLFIFLASRHPVMEDTDLYHVQIIRWNQRYGTVPGLANLYLRYGFYSNWFHLISIFTFPFHHQNFLFLNLTLGCWFLIFLLHKLQLHLSNRDNPVNRIAGIFYFLTLAYMLAQWNLFRGNASSTTYDFIVTVLLLIALLLITESFLLNKDPGNKLFLISFFCIASLFFKITGVAALFILFVYLLLHTRSLKKYLAAVFLFILFLVPCVTRNYIQTGYFFYPYTGLSNFLKPDWQVPKQLLTGFTDYISLGNKYINQSIPAEGWEHTREILFAWIPVWIRHLTLFDKMITGLAFAGFILSFFIPGLKRSKLRIIYYSCVAIIPCWFFTAPDPRFAYGLLIFTAFLPAGFLLEKFFRKNWINAGLFLMISGMAVYASQKLKNFQAENFVHPPSIPVPPNQKIITGGLSFYLPGIMNDNWNTRCYDAPLPCIYQLNPYLEPRGKEVKEGFRMRPVTDTSFILNFRY